MKKTIKWTIFIFILIIFYFFPLIQFAIGKGDLTYLEKQLNWFSAGISVVSLALGTISMSISSADEKQLENKLKLIKEIQNDENKTLLEIKDFSQTIKDSQVKITDLQQEMKTVLVEIKYISQHIQNSQEGVINKFITAALCSVFSGTRADWFTDQTGKNE